MRIGLGYDIHKLSRNRKLILGGIEIPSDVGLLGHSDADALTHSIIDAILGSIAKRDIGYHFPDTDDRYENVSSLYLLQETLKILNFEGYKIVNVDSNIICEGIKLLPYIDLMRETLAIALSLPIEDVSIKAKTNEGLDSLGDGLAIATQAVVLVEKIDK